MSKYIFLTNEGYTYQPNSESIEPDCENSQLIGIANGDNQEDAFKNLMEKYNYLKDSNFDEIYCYKLDDNYENSRKWFCMQNE